MNVMGRSKRLLAGALTMGAAFVAFGVAGPAPAAEGPQVLMVDNEPDLTRWHFGPAEITVPAGTTVVWFNKGKEDHSVTADDKSFDSGLKKTGATFSRVFPQAGKYTYHCAPHPWMKGTVEVVAARIAAAAPPGEASTTTIATSAAAPAPAATAPTSTPEATPAPAAEPPSPPPGTAPESEETAAASHRKGSGNPLAGTLAVVLLPTLGALALGAKLRHARS